MEITDKMMAAINAPLEIVDYLIHNATEMLCQLYFGTSVENKAALECLFPDLQQRPEPTCKTCDFYENDCPFTRGKFIPYPNHVCKDYTCSAMKEQPHFANVSKMVQPAVEQFTEKIKDFQARYKHPEIVSIKGAMAFMARMFYQYPYVARLWYEQLPKATMD